ncbi:CHAT domain-containing protein [Xanthobacteraceae bacterium A53D]
MNGRGMNTGIGSLSRRLFLLSALGLLLATPLQAQEPVPGQDILYPKMEACERLLAKGEQARGVPCLRSALKGIAAGTDDVRTLTDYRTWAEAFVRARSIGLARELYEEGLATKAAQKPSADLGRLHFSYSWRLLSRTADTDLGLKHARTALDMLERTLKPDAYDTIAARDSLASLLTNTGAVAPGLNLAEQNFRIAIKALGEEEPLTWRTANNFAEALRSIGRPEAAVPIDRMLLRKRVAHYGEGSIQALVSASNQALNYLELGDKEEALKHFELQARFGRKLADPTSEHEAQGKAWIVYANILFAPDETLKPAELKALTELKDWRSAPEIMQVRVAQLAAFHNEKQGKVRQGLALREAAHKVAQATFTERNPITFNALLGVAEAHVRNGEAEQALALFVKLDRQLHAWALQEIGTAGNRYIAETTRVLADNFLHAFGSFALETEAARPAFADAAARWKAMESGERTRLRLMVDSLPEPLKGETETVIRLLGKQQELLSEKRSEKDRAADAELVDELEARMSALSGKLAAVPAPSSSVGEALGAREALINYVVITRRTGLRSSAGAIEDERLIAVVRRAGKAPAVVDLGRMAAIERRIRMEDVAAAPTKEMYRALLSPLMSHLGDVERLFLVPAAPLYGVPFALLETSFGRHLDEVYELRILTREDALLTATRQDRLAAGGKAVLAGGLDFRAGKQKGARPLPATAREVAAIGRTLEGAGYGTTVLTGAEGTERALRGVIGQAGIVHLATHGFFEPPRGNLSALWRGGLVLARSGSSRPARPDAGDGWLYAAELMDWDLSAADLVVLSACETGVGDESAVSAIRGLPTALGIAGARRSLLTLWPVEDQGAANFMIAFYGHLTAPGTTYAQALRQTRLDAMAGKIEAADDPEVWASFVMFEG